MLSEGAITGAAEATSGANPTSLPGAAGTPAFAATATGATRLGWVCATAGAATVAVPTKPGAGTTVGVDAKATGDATP